jgi:hypothetical protein
VNKPILELEVEPRSLSKFIGPQQSVKTAGTNGDKRIHLPGHFDMLSVTSIVHVSYMFGLCL